MLTRWRLLVGRSAGVGTAELALYQLPTFGQGWRARSSAGLWTACWEVHLSTDEGSRTRVNWSRLTIETAAIVFSILLAFAIDAWWERQRDRALEIETLNSLLAEFEANQALLPRYIQRHGVVGSSLLEVYGGLEAAAPGAEVAVTDTLLVWAVRNVSFEPQGGALSALLQSGDLGRISNPDLREALASWPAQVLDATENELIQNRDLRPPLLTLLGAQVDLGRVLRTYSADGPMTSQGELTLVASTELASRLVLLAGGSVGARNEEVTLLAYADAIVELLQAELQR